MYQIAIHDAFDWSIAAHTNGGPNNAILLVDTAGTLHRVYRFTERPCLQLFQLLEASREVLRRSREG